MKLWELLGDSFVNLGRRRLRTLFSVLAVFIGAFTLALTMGIGTGVRGYIDDQLQSLGGEQTLFVSAEQATPEESGDLVPYSEDNAEGYVMVDASDRDRVAELSHVSEVILSPSITVSYISSDSSERYQTSLGDSIPGLELSLVAGRQLDDDAEALEVVLPESYTDDLGYSSAADAVGSAVTFGVRDAAMTTHEVEAEVVGVFQAGILDSGPRGNLALTDDLHAAQMTGLPEEATGDYPGMVAITTDHEAATGLIEDAGYRVSSLSDQLGDIQAVVDGIVLILNIFAILALITAAFGIVNSLLMSVQERTREIGLLRAMGMRRSNVFALFSLEAVWIGLIGAVLAVVAAALVGTAVSGPLAQMLEIDLPGLQLVAFQPAPILLEVLVILVLAFVAAIFPARHAARLNPIDALRHE